MENDNRVLVYRAQIEALLFTATISIKTKDTNAFASAAGQLLTLSEDIDVPSALRDVASEIHDQLASDMTDAGLKLMNESVAELSGAVNELQIAIDTAKHGQEKLFFPALANAAASALKTFNNLKTAVDKVQGDLRAASGAQLGDVPEKLKDLLADLKNLQKAGKQIG